MANLKNITDLPVVESVEGLNLIVNDNGSAKQVPATAIGGKGVSSWNDLSDKPTESIDGAEKLKEEIIPDTIARVSALSSYALKSEIPSVDGLATEEFVEAQTTGMAEKSHTHSWDDISDQPFGNTVEKETVYLSLDIPVFSETSYKVSSDGSEINTLNPYGMTLYVEFDKKIYECTIENMGGKQPGQYSLRLGNKSLLSSTFPDNGMPFNVLFNQSTKQCTVYLQDSTKSHTIEVFKGTIGVKPIEEKFIPDTIARVSDIPSIPTIPTEDWVFTLEDGSTVTKKVAVMS